MNQNSGLRDDAGRGRFRVFGAMVVATAVCLLLFAAREARAHPDGSFPRTVNLDWRDRINAFYDARYDVLVHSARVDNAQLDSLRMYNPSIVRLVETQWYVYYNTGPSGYPADKGPWPATDPMHGYERKYWDILQNNNWWLYARDSSGVRYKATHAYGYWSGNFTSKCPKNAQGKRLCDVFGDFVVDELILKKRTEGVFFDYTAGGFSWMNWTMYGNCPLNQNCLTWGGTPTPETKYHTAFDADNNGTVDHPDSLDKWWKEGVTIVAKRIRQRLGPAGVIVGNGNQQYTDMNGAMLEKFPRVLGVYDPAPNPYGYKWNSGINHQLYGYLSSIEHIFTSPRYNMIDLESGALNEFEPIRTPDRERYKRLSLGSCLLGDGYHSSRALGNSTMYWEPEWDMRLGWPLGPARTYDSFSRKVYVRNFTNGDVYVNPNGFDMAATVNYPAIPAWDAIIVQRSLPVELPVRNRPVVNLAAPSPNPSRGQFALHFDAPRDTPLSLHIYDARGRLVKDVWSGVGTGSPQTAIWDGSHTLGFNAPAGVYMARLHGEGVTAERLLVRIR